MNITMEWLKSEKACEEAVKWAKSRLNGGKPLSECIEGMERADWLLWLLHHAKVVNIRQLMWLSLIGPRRALKHAGVARPQCKDAIEKTESWVEHPTAAAGRAAEAAGWAADAAGRAADAAGWAAEAAGWAAGAAGRAADAAGWAAYAAGRAADAAGRAAGAAGRATEHKAICGLIRAELEKPMFKALVWPVEGR